MDKKETHTITITNLSYTYPDGTQALDSISLTIEKGTTTAILGPNGAGKSTLLKHLNGIIMPQSGEIIIENQKLEKKTAYDVRKKVGLVFQNPDDMLFLPTVREDIEFGPRNLNLDEPEIAKRTEEALKTVGMAGFEDKNPHNLSQGQKKKISIACVLSMRPDIIAFDEPFAHLDHRSKKELKEIIQNIKSTKIIATHDTSILESCDLSIIMEDGKIAYKGQNPKREILESHNLI